MRALVFGGPRQMRVEERPDPEPGPREAVVHIAATGICGSDLHGYLGETGRRVPGMVMGHETVGIVEALGGATDGSTSVETGTRVTINPVVSCGVCSFCEAGLDNQCVDRRVIGVTPELAGAYAERIVVPARNLVALSPDAPLEWGALVEPLAVGFHAVRRGGPPGDVVLVVGGGAIGQACLLAARREGARTIVLSEPIAHRREAAAALGAVTVDPTREGVAAVVREHSEHGASLVLDAVGSSASIGTALSATAPDGTVVLVGMNEPDVQLELYEVTVPERRLIGTFCYTREHFEETADWVSSAPPELARLIDRRIGFDDIIEGFDALAVGEMDAVKALLITGP